VSFVYNVGSGNFEKSTLLRLLNQGNHAAVPTELKKWTKGRQNGQLVDLPGLVKRRASEAELFQKPRAGRSTEHVRVRDVAVGVCRRTVRICPGAIGAIELYDFWAVWCVNENCFLPEIFLSERAAQSSAQQHQANTTHRAVATVVRMVTISTCRQRTAGRRRRWLSGKTRYFPT